MAQDGLTIDTRAWSKSLSDLEKKVLPKVVANVVNSALFEARKTMPESLKANLHRPTPFTLRGWLVEKAKPGKNVDEISGRFFARDKQNSYLQYLIFGGTRHAGDPGATGSNIPIPTGQKSQYGGVPKRYLKKLSAEYQEEKRYRKSGRSAFIKKGIYIARDPGDPRFFGYWRRPEYRRAPEGKKHKGVIRTRVIGDPKLLLRFVDTTEHKPIFRQHYDDVVNQSWAYGVRTFPQEMKRALAKLRK